jgi:hypothetical protein
MSVGHRAWTRQHSCRSASCSTAVAPVNPPLSPPLSPVTYPSSRWQDKQWIRRSNIRVRSTLPGARRMSIRKLRPSLHPNFPSPYMNRLGASRSAVSSSCRIRTEVRATGDWLAVTGSLPTRAIKPPVHVGRGKARGPPRLLASSSPAGPTTHSCAIPVSWHRRNSLLLCVALPPATRRSAVCKPESASMEARDSCRLLCRFAARRNVAPIPGTRSDARTPTAMSETAGAGAVRGRLQGVALSRQQAPTPVGSAITAPAAWVSPRAGAERRCR